MIDTRYDQSDAIRLLDKINSGLTRDWEKHSRILHVLRAQGWVQWNHPGDTPTITFTGRKALDLDMNGINPWQ